jgi:hypothetical protein
MAAAQCRKQMADERTTVTWTVAGMPPTYVERRMTADVPASLRPELQALLMKARFFDLPTELGGNPAAGRDMASYSITVTSSAGTHTVHFSDSTVTQELANLRAWIVEHLSSTASPA